MRFLRSIANTLKVAARATRVAEECTDPRKMREALLKEIEEAIFEEFALNWATPPKAAAAERVKVVAAVAGATQDST